MNIVPPLPEFLARARDKRMPIYCDILADLDTPLTAYWKLAFDAEVSFLLESVTGGEQVGRYSIIGVRPGTVLRTKGREVVANGERQADLSDEEDPLHRLEALMARRETVPVEGLPRFCGGAVGMVSYDFVRFIERLPDAKPDDLDLPDLAMMLADTIVVFDHARNTVRIVCLVDGTEDAYRAATEEIDRIGQRMRAGLPTLPIPSDKLPDYAPKASVPTSNTTQDEFEDAVRKTLEYIRAGDGIQMVLSQRVSQAVDCHPVTLYRALRALNPSPYMFLIRFGDFDLIGASPELLVSHHAGKATLRPIAGTRGRGKDEAEDDQLAEDLLRDEKERAEHIMLVDLGRNDLGKVCKTGTVSVDQLMVIEKYSHVMHIVSEVSGILDESRSVYDLIRATFPAGTLSGAPKVRAMEIIEELEPSRRGVYGGAVGTISPFGDVDLAIAIRTIVLKDNVAHVQAGAGVVADSDPTKEWEETWHKASAALRAIDLAQRGL